jgi:hypothetical protein
MIQNDIFTETSGFAETRLKHYWHEIVPNSLKWIVQTLHSLYWYELARNEPVLVVPAGVEPTTDRLEICCSIQLSYGTNINTSRGRQIRTADLHVPNVAR